MNWLPEANRRRTEAAADDGAQTRVTYLVLIIWDVDKLCGMDTAH